MKPDTQAFYEHAVRRAVERITRALDEALDLTALARAAALSPLHFHHIFRGMVGETPLELHRRLRMERAAFQLLSSQAQVTSVAFDAGYETHEAFTRAFRQAFGASPSEFRQKASGAREACAAPALFLLQASCGVHFESNGASTRHLTFNTGERIMDVQIEQRSEQRAVAVHHRGPYNRISQAFAKLGEVAGAAGLLGRPDTEMLAIYYDDPEANPAEQLRSDAAISVPEGTPVPPELSELTIPGGRYARTTHVGPYTGLGDAWSRFMGVWLPESGHRLGSGVTFEVYRNTPMNASPEQLRTDLYVPIA